MLLGQSGTDGASVGDAIGNLELVKMRDAVEVIHGLGPPVDLAVLNMEGGEWPLIPYLLDNLMHHRIASMAIQWHPKYVSNARACRVTDYLGEYYTVGYNDFPTWTHWTRK